MNVTVLGSINMDIVMSVDTLPQSGETITASGMNLYPGGKGANQAIASALCGANTSIIGAVGNDAYGQSLAANLKSNQVDTSQLSLLKDAETGQAFICVGASGENSIVVLPGANHRFRFSGNLKSRPESLPVRLTQFEMPLTEIKAFFEDRFYGTGIKILNAAPAVANGEALFGMADIIILNETELAFFCNIELHDSYTLDSIVTSALKLLSRSKQWIIVTLGSNGAMAISRETTISVGGFDVPVVDTTGAGDCFCGAMATSLSAGDSMDKAILFANAAASLAVTKVGASPSMPTREGVAALIKNNPGIKIQEVSS